MTNQNIWKWTARNSHVSPPHTPHETTMSHHPTHHTKQPCLTTYTPHETTMSHHPHTPHETTMSHHPTHHTKQPCLTTHTPHETTMYDVWQVHATWQLVKLKRMKHHIVFLRLFSPSSEFYKAYMLAITTLLFAAISTATYICPCYLWTRDMYFNVHTILYVYTVDTVCSVINLFVFVFYRSYYICLPI